MQTRAIAGLPNPAAEAYHTLLDCSAAGKHAVFCSASEERLGQYIDAASALSALDKFKPAPLTALLAGSPHAVSMALGRLRQARMQKRPALAALAAGEEAPRLFSPEEYECLLLELKIGLRARRSTLADSLEKAGYERKDFLEQPGEYAIRGAVLDIFAVDQEHPCRLFMAGDYLESMRFFNPDTQESTGPCMGLTVLPACFPKQGEESPLDEWFETKPEKLYDSFPQAPAPPPWLGAVSAILAPLDLSTEGSADAGLLPNPMFGADMRMLGTELERPGQGRSGNFHLLRQHRRSGAPWRTDVGLRHKCETIIFHRGNGTRLSGPKAPLCRRNRLRNFQPGLLVFKTPAPLLFRRQQPRALRRP